MRDQEDAPPPVRAALGSFPENPALAGPAVVSSGLLPNPQRDQMKKQNPPSVITGALLLGAAFVSLAVPRAAAQTAGYATQVLDYTVGTGISSTYANAGSALGQPGGNVGSGTLNPFVPNYAGTELTGIGPGGQLTLGLSNFVTVAAAGTAEIGIFGNVGLVNAGTSGAPAAGNPATAFGVRTVQISVSADGINFVPLAAGALITSTLPANFYTNPDTTNVNAPPPANPTLADFGKPFMGSLASFNGETYAQTLTTLNGSAGGTWLDLSSTGLAQVGYIRFDEPASGGPFYLNGVSSNETLLGAPVPEPGAAALLALAGGLGALAWRRGRPAFVSFHFDPMHTQQFLSGRQPSRRLLAAVLLAAAALLPSTGRAQLIGSLTEGAANLPYTYYLTIQFDNGHYYDFTLNSSMALYTGTSFINTVAADSQGTAFVMTVDQELYDTSNYVNGITINSDADSGFQNNGFWSYWNGSATTPVQWTYSQVGEDDRTITPGEADGWVFGNDVNGTNPPQAVVFPAPEPSTWLLTGLPLAAWGLLGRRARRGRKTSPANV